MKSLLPKLIEEEQSAFLQGRDISHNVLLAQEMVQHLDKRVRGHNIMFKLDMMKAFDRVSWDFLQRCLLKFGFHPLFVQLIMNNLSASWFSILINGSQSGFLKSSRGVKQGDPFSPYLFLLVVEALSRGLKGVALRLLFLCLEVLEGFLIYVLQMTWLFSQGPIGSISAPFLVFWSNMSGLRVS